MITLKLTSSKSTNGMLKARPVIGFYSEGDAGTVWKSRIEQDLPQFQFELLKDVEDKRTVRYALVWNPPAGFLEGFVNLEAIFVLGAGVDSLLKDPDLPQVPIVRLSDAGMAQQMAHYVIYGVLRFQRRFEAYQQLQDARRWAPIEDIEPIEQFPVGVMGLGAIGSIVARQLAVIGFPVLGWSADHKVIDNIRTFDGETGLSAFLSESRVVVNLLPLTDKTEGLINKKFFSRMSAESFLINIGRGQHICEDDVLEALEEGLIAGAMLDVFEAEPLPSKSPLWNHPKVIITPHVSGLTVPQAALDQIIGNIKRIENGHALDSVVDRIKGY